ncbi:hypothetical protein [Paenibacillus soyae]|uniref:Uncharacterized protein n=1 Tax=Paenibacillus soyae TaxID=2969249 RepID=A0A9X2MNG7_9BACL|nr:hypothetical protein [Paenibacillus soyae]MCR2803979.1 hypothetical protein [Paenibacillus soyae]
MGFVVAFVAAWFALFIFYGMNKRLSIVENAFVFLASMALGIHLSWFIVEEFKWIEMTKDGLSYAGVLLYRIVLFPMVFVLVMNAVYKLRGIAGQLLSGVTALASLAVLNMAFVAYDMIRYTKWNLFYETLVTALLLLIVYVLLRGFRKAADKRWAA